jgi:hypothetical protein
MFFYYYPLPHQNVSTSNRVFNIAYYLAWCLVKHGATCDELAKEFESRVEIICMSSVSFREGTMNVDASVRQWASGLQ